MASIVRDLNNDVVRGGRQRVCMIRDYIGGEHKRMEG